MPKPWEKWFAALWLRMGGALGPSTTDLAIALAEDVPPTDAETLREIDGVNLFPPALFVPSAAADDLSPYAVPELQAGNTAPADAYMGELAGGRDTKLHSHAITFLTPSSLTLNAGTGTGTVAGVQTMFDGSVYNIAEVAGTPGFDVEFNFTGVTRIRGVQVRMNYQSTLTHVVEIDIWNYTSAAWDVLRSVVGNMGGYDIMPAFLQSDTNYISSGSAKIRVYHVSAGNAAHQIDIDFAALIV